MNRKSSGFDLLSGGLILSLAAHFLSAFFFAPSLQPLALAPVRGEADFLGALLTETDFASPGRSVRPVRSVILQEPDLSGEARSQKIDSLSSKPEARFSEDLSSQEKKSTYPVRVPSKRVPGMDTSPSQWPKEVVFGFKDYADQLYAVDLSELEKVAGNEELGGVVDLKVLVGRGGEVLEVKKMSGCGDPAFDLNLILKLKKSVFKSIGALEPIWVRVKFKLR